MDLLGTILEIVVVLLFVAFLVGTIVRIAAMLERREAGHSLDRDRLVFFFVGCLMLVCLFPLRMFGLLRLPGLVGDLTVVLANAAGFVLTYRGSGTSGNGGVEGEVEPETRGTRAYQVYYRGKSFGLVTKSGFDRLMEYGLLKKQRTVELEDDYRERARKQGVEVLLLQNRDGSQTLIKVEPLERPG